MYKLGTVILVVLTFIFSVGGVFLVMNDKIKEVKEERGTSLAMNAEITKRIIFLKKEIRKIKEAQIEEAFLETHNGISLNMWVKTNIDHNLHSGRIAGKVVDFRYRGEAYPIAVLRGGKEVSVFWLVLMKTQRD